MRILCHLCTCSTTREPAHHYESFDWLTGLPVESEENDQLWVNFCALFDQLSPNYFVLATPESDAQINFEMRNMMFDLRFVTC